MSRLVVVVAIILNLSSFPQSILSFIQQNISKRVTFANDIKKIVIPPQWLIDH